MHSFAQNTVKYLSPKQAKTRDKLSLGTFILSIFRYKVDILGLNWLKLDLNGRRARIFNLSLIEQYRNTYQNGHEST